MESDYILINPEKPFEELLALIGNPTTRYIVVKTKYTTHHIEKLASSVKDRGNLKWIAETNSSTYYDGLEEKDKEAFSSHIDNADLFPRLYFLPQTFCREFKCWLAIRILSVTEIKVEIEYSPAFTQHEHESFFKKLILISHRKESKDNYEY